MTTIATDGITIAADSQVSYDEGIERFPVTKIIAQNGRVYAFVGKGALFLPMIKWYEAGCKPRELPYLPYSGFKPESNLLIFDEGKLFDVNMDLPYKMEVSFPTAYGSGSKWAMGALVLGHTPEEAVWAATQCDPWSGGEVQVMHLPSAASAVPARAKGALARAASMTSERRSEIGKMGAAIRWKKGTVI